MQTPPDTGLLQVLTARELQIAQLLAQGMRNREIAERLFIAQGTVKVHVENILNKLGVGTRTEVAVWFARTAPEVAESSAGN